MEPCSRSRACRFPEAVLQEASICFSSTPLPDWEGLLGMPTSTNASLEPGTHNHARQTHTFFLAQLIISFIQIHLLTLKCGVIQFQYPGPGQSCWSKVLTDSDRRAPGPSRCGYYGCCGYHGCCDYHGCRGWGSAPGQPGNLLLTYDCTRSWGAGHTNTHQCYKTT